MGRVRGISLVLVALVVVACGDEVELPPLTDPTTSSIEILQGAADTPPTSSAMTLGSTTTTTIVFELHDEPVGSQAKFEEQVQVVYDKYGHYAAPRDTVPLPDTTNPDPVVAFGEMIGFHYWMLSTNPWPQWVKIYALDQTNYELLRYIQADSYSAPPALLYFDQEPFAFLDGIVISIEAVGAPSRVTDGLPDSAVGIEYRSTVGDFYAANLDDGSVFDAWDGWSELVSQAIVVPTDAGWRIAYVRWND